MLHHRFLLVIFPFFLAACQGAHKDATAQGMFTQGQARVVSVDADLGYAVLNIDGANVEAYWQTEHSLAQPGATYISDVNKPPVGVYREPSVVGRTFEAKPGDLIAFKGMKTGSSIFLQGISVISH
jgi:hypothetical protein